MTQQTDDEVAHEYPESITCCGVVLTRTDVKNVKAAYMNESDENPLRIKICRHHDGAWTSGHETVAGSKLWPVVFIGDTPESAAQQVADSLKRLAVAELAKARFWQKLAAEE